MMVLEIVSKILNENEFTRSMSFAYDEQTDRLRFEYKGHEVELYLHDIRLKSTDASFIVNKSFSIIRASEETGARHIAHYLIESLKRRQAMTDIQTSDIKTYKITYQDNGALQTESIEAFTSMEALRKFTEALGMRKTVYMEFISIERE